MGLPLCGVEMLAKAYRADGHVEKAVELLEHVVAVNIRVHAANRLASERNLAIAYQVDSQVKKALKLLEHVVAVQGCLRKSILIDWCRSTSRRTGEGGGAAGARRRGADKDACLRKGILIDWGRRKC